MVDKDAILVLLGDRPVAYHPLLAKKLGGVEVAVFVSQLLYWTGKGKMPGGWIYKTIKEFEAETGLTRHNQKTARTRLIKLGVLEEALRGVPATMHFRLNLDILAKILNCSLPQYGKLVSRNTANKFVSSRQTPEITTESPSEEEEAEHLPKILDLKKELPCLEIYEAQHGPIQNGMLARITQAHTNPAIPRGWLEYTILATARPNIQNPEAYFDATLRDCIAKGGPPAPAKREAPAERKPKRERGSGIVGLRGTGKDMENEPTFNPYTGENIYPDGNRVLDPVAAAAMAAGEAAT